MLSCNKLSSVALNGEVGVGQGDLEKFTENSYGVIEAQGDSICHLTIWLRYKVSVFVFIAWFWSSSMANEKARKEVDDLS